MQDPPWIVIDDMNCMIFKVWIVFKIVNDFPRSLYDCCMPCMLSVIYLMIYRHASTNADAKTSGRWWRWWWRWPRWCQWWRSRPSRNAAAVNTATDAVTTTTTTTEATRHHSTHVCASAFVEMCLGAGGETCCGVVCGFASLQGKQIVVWLLHGTTKHLLAITQGTQITSQRFTHEQTLVLTSYMKTWWKVNKNRLK